MTRTEIFDKLKEIIKPYINDQDAYANLSENSDLLRDLKINSAHLVDIVLDAETAFNISIDDDSMEKMATMKDAVDIIGSKMAA
jgi:acyl carrier protein